MRGYVTAKDTSLTGEDALKKLAEELKRADVVVVGAGAGLSTAAGMIYDGDTFTKIFGDFEEAYGFHDMYSGSFYPFETPEERWAYMSRMIMVNRFEKAKGSSYDDLRQIINGKDYFVITTNVDHQFQFAGFDKQRLFYTQGDYGLWQCSVPCHNKTYDNETAVKRMVAEQSDMRVPNELVPTCPVCRKPMSMNLRSDNTFVEDDGWHEASGRYSKFLNEHKNTRIVYLELGVGFNTPGIIKYPFWQFTVKNPKATYACLNLNDAICPKEIAEQALLIDGDLEDNLSVLRSLM